MEVHLVSSSVLPTRHGDFTAHAFRAQPDGVEHLALVCGVVEGKTALVRLHSECLTGEALGSLRCDCGAQLDEALARIADEGSGVLVYLRGHEGRGIGIANKIAAYGLQDAGADTVSANERLGLPVDARDFSAGAMILRSLGVAAVRLLTNNPVKEAALTGLGVPVIERVATGVHATPQNVLYLDTKARRMGHRLDAGRVTVNAGAGEEELDLTQAAGCGGAPTTPGTVSPCRPGPLR